MRESTLQGPASFRAHAVRLIPPLHLHGHSTFLSSPRHITISPAQVCLNGKMGRNNFSEGNFRFMTSYPLLGGIDSHQLSFILSTGGG